MATEVKETTIVGGAKLNLQPCRNCTERHSGCHGSCEKYIAVQQYNEKKKAVLRAEKLAAGECYRTLVRTSAVKKK